MKKLFSIILSMALLILPSFVFAQDTNITLSGREQALEVAKQYISGGGIDRNISIEGADLSNLEVRDIVPEIFMPIKVDNNLSLEDSFNSPSGYTAVVWSGDIPCTLLIIKYSKEGDMYVSGGTAGNVDAFAQRLETMRSMTINNEVGCISLYNLSNYYFYGKTDDGYRVIPMLVFVEHNEKVRQQYTDNVVMTQSVFEIASREQLSDLREKADAGFMGGFELIEAFLPVEPSMSAYELILILVGIVALIVLFIIVLRHIITRAKKET